jgi:guanylate kinase
MAGQLLIVAAPSGAGKTSLVQALLKLEPELKLSISYTTRPPRPGEVDGVHYHFVDRQRFEQLIADNTMLEHAEVHGNFYGTGRSLVEAELARGLDVLLEIDWQGAAQVRARFDQVHAVFILPPSRQALLERLNKRGQDSTEVIERRLKNARSEMEHCLDFDYVIVNDQFETALKQLQCVLAAVRVGRKAQQRRLKSLLDTLLA